MISFRWLFSSFKLFRCRCKIELVLYFWSWIYGGDIKLIEFIYLFIQK